MTIELPWNVGDKLWIVDFFSYTREVTCLKCKNGKVILADGSEMPCGLCNGRGTHCIHFPHMGRPVYLTITGCDIHRASLKDQDVWWYTDKRGYFSRTDDFVKTFKEARVLARALNKKYNWPKEKHERDVYTETHKMFWGYRVPGTMRR